MAVQTEDKKANRANNNRASRQVYGTKVRDCATSKSMIAFSTSEFPSY